VYGSIPTPEASAPPTRSENTVPENRSYEFDRLLRVH